MTCPEAKIVQWRPRDGPARRIEFEPLANGDFRRSERVWANEHVGWRTTGVEVVESISFAGVGSPDAHTAFRGP